MYSTVLRFSASPSPSWFVAANLPSRVCGDNSSFPNSSAAHPALVPYVKERTFCGWSIVQGTSPCGVVDAKDIFTARDRRNSPPKQLLLAGRSRKVLRTHRHLQRPRCLQPSSINLILLRNFAHCVRVHHIGPGRQSITERNLEIHGSLFQRKSLIRDGRCPPILTHRQHVKREVEVLRRFVCDLDAPLNPATSHVRRHLPFED